MIRAIIFDFDGLMMNTEEAVFEAMQELYAAHGGSLSADVWMRSIGSTDAFDAYHYLESQIGRAIDREEAREAFRARAAELLVGEPLLPGVQSYLDEARALGLHLAVASSSSRDWVEGYLTGHKIHDRFHCIRCADDVKRTKPDPELFATALERLGVEASEALVLEDSPNGVRAAAQLGIFTVAVPGPLTSAHPFDEADLRLDSLEAMPLRELVALAETRIAASAAAGAR